MQKIKDFLVGHTGRVTLTAIIIILVGISSFGLGRLSQKGQAGLKIDFKEPMPYVESVTTGSAYNSVVPVKKEAPVPKIYFASSRGKKYYHVGCSGGKTLKEENKIFFNTKEDAERAGYELSSTCK